MNYWERPLHVRVNVVVCRTCTSVGRYLVGSCIVRENVGNCVRLAMWAGMRVGDGGRCRRAWYGPRCAGYGEEPWCSGDVGCNATLMCRAIVLITSLTKR